MRPIVSIAAAMFALASAARAGIFQWEYINAADPSQGKRQSTTLASDGAGVDAVPGVSLEYRDVTMAYLIGADLTGAYAYSANLTDADLSQANLTNANFWRATVTGAEFREANLTNTHFGDADLSGANFGKANLTNARFDYARLTDANLTDAFVHGANFRADRCICDASGKITIFGGITLPQLYSTASYQLKDLGGISLFFNDLASGDFAGQNLTNANFAAATLTGADFAGADVRGAFFTGSASTGFTAAQLYSTASYQAHNLTGILFLGGDLTGWNFAGQNLTKATFGYSSPTTLTDADFVGADVRGAVFNPGGAGLTKSQLYSTASYQAHDLTGIHLAYNDLSGWNFAAQNIANASFSGATLTDADFTEANLSNATFHSATLTRADFTDAEVRGANFGILFDFGSSYGTGITLTQLYSTASYRAHDLSGINLILNNLAGGNFVGQNLANADFSRTECGTFGCYPISATLTDADLTAADARGTDLFTSVCNRGGCYVVGEGAIVTNLIRYDGHIHGLELDGGGLLLVRDHDYVPITVDQHLTMAPGGTLRMVFEADAWDSRISFAPGIPVMLGGTLELTFAHDVNPASQLGRTFNLFDWTGVTPAGTFAISSPYTWDISNLYTTGEVTLTAVPEPGALPLFSIALVAFVAMGREKPSSTSRIGENQ